MSQATSFVLTGRSSWGWVVVGTHLNVLDNMGELTHTFSFANSFQHMATQALLVHGIGLSRFWYSKDSFQTFVECIVELLVFRGNLVFRRYRIHHFDFVSSSQGFVVLTSVSVELCFFNKTRIGP